ncbi:RTA1 like protein-domain-containing protein [Dactylonectria estremocensis]|uniref:RTA1 like protein-domain-containing protein n=1 Tax=Dactylonectria estremocensis TaxID=1079267 RepID=A0A9P9DZN3_9HYPO|nr:RTA1 like protein-domain-containing protein [Dactylonectria estremocensis]
MASIFQIRAELSRVDLSLCEKVTDTCPVEASTLGYGPNLGASIFFAIGFGCLFVASVTLGIWKKTYTYAAAIALGLLLETLGHIGRALMHDNPWNKGAFQLQICAIILAPTFICISIYLTLKHVTLAISPSISRIAPKWYPIIFLPADVSCLILQALGGGLAAAAKKDKPDLLDAGNRLIIAGIVLQVVVLGVFGLMALDYLARAKKQLHGPEVTESGLRTWKDKRFRQFGGAVLAAYIMIFTRCVYRIAEMAGGWGNHIMQDEPSFLVLDSTLVLVGSALLTIYHPGLFFPRMGNRASGGDLEKTETQEMSDRVLRSSG